MSVVPRVDSTDKQEWFAYSTGIYARFRHPEIIVLGLDQDTGTAIINEIGNVVKGGRKFELDTDYDDVFDDNLKCRFRSIHISQYSEYVCWSQWFYENNDFPVWQCFWPDKGGYHPWEDACDPEIADLQPRLC